MNDKRGIKKHIISLVLTLAVIAVLLISGPVKALTIYFTPNSDDGTYKLTDKVAVWTLSVDIEDGETIPVQNITVQIYYPNGTSFKFCTFEPGNTSSKFGCANINITSVRAWNWTRVTSQYAYGYGYAPNSWGGGFLGAGGNSSKTKDAGANIANSSVQTWYNDTEAYGYQYSYQSGITDVNGEMLYNITWNLTAEALDVEGNYTVDTLLYVFSNYSAAASASGARIFSMSPLLKIAYDNTAPAAPATTGSVIEQGSNVNCVPTGCKTATTLQISCNKGTDAISSSTDVTSNISGISKPSGGSTDLDGSFTDTLVSGTYTVTCQTTDKAGNYRQGSFTFALSGVTSSASGGGGGGGGEEAPATQYAATTTTSLEGLSDWSTDKPVEVLGVSEGQSISFSMKGASHSFTVTSIDYFGGEVTVEIASEPITLTLKKGIKQEVDVNADGEKDLALTLTGFTNMEPNIRFEKLAGFAEKKAAPTGEAVTPPTGEEEQPTIIPSKERSKAFMWAWIVVAVLAIATIAYFKRDKLKKIVKQ
ncbi:hypothetical protein HY643_02730 [Candidatus Woesearchaeota archaeon]|nr:hypothetical protein [Candidatus Woesearchaeota archaeon]